MVRRSQTSAGGRGWLGRSTCRPPMGTQLHAALNPRSSPRPRGPDGSPGAFCPPGPARSGGPEAHQLHRRSPVSHVFCGTVSGLFRTRDLTPTYGTIDSFQWPVLGRRDASIQRRAHSEAHTERARRQARPGRAGGVGEPDPRPAGNIRQRKRTPNCPAAASGGPAICPGLGNPVRVGPGLSGVPNADGRPRLASAALHGAARLKHSDPAGFAPTRHFVLRGHSPFASRSPPPPPCPRPA